MRLDKRAVVLTHIGHARPLPPVPSNVADAVCQRWPERGPLWLATVHDGLTDLCKRYRAEPVQVMSARYGFVVAVCTPTGPLIMRSSPDPDGGNQAAVSIALADLGVSPRVHELVETNTGTWTVADRVLPGTPIEDVPSQSDRVRMADMLRRMVGQPAPASNMPSLIDWLRDRLTDPYLTDLPVGRRPAPIEERQQALRQLETLARAGSVSLCHGDASPRNILLGANDKPWLVDPRGMIGEVAYDVAVIALKAARFIPPVAGAAELAKYVGINAEQAIAWLQIAQSARV